MKFSIQRKQLKAMARLSAVKDVRYYLQGINIVQDNRGTYIESTNGYIMGRLLIDETPCNTACSVIIPSDAVKTLGATGKRGDESICFSVDGEKITAITPDGSSIICSAHVARYPDIDRVIPQNYSDSQIAPSTYQPEYIMAFQECGNDLRGSKNQNNNISIMQRGNDSGIVIIMSEPLFIGIIMPMRDTFTVSIPAWCNRPKIKTLETESA